MSRVRGSILLTAGVIGALALMVAPVQADTFRPTRFTDPPPNGCKPTNCSLREAVIAAGASQGADSVRLAEGTYALKIAPTGGPDAQEGDLDLKGPMLIKGPGQALTTVRQFTTDRVLTLGNGRQTLKRFGVLGGQADLGGGILARPAGGDDRLVLMTVALNSATQRGGGIYADGRNLTISKSSIDSNSAGEAGGGIASCCTAENLEIRLNSSTVHSNTTGGVGGGIALSGPPPGEPGRTPAVDAINSTISTNSANVSGGGISTIFGGYFDGDYMTVADNVADADNVGGGVGGGTHLSGLSYIELEDSILGRNSVGSSGAGPMCGGEVRLPQTIIQGQSAGVCTLVGGSVTITENPPKIGALTSNGGPTLTYELLTASGAIGFAIGCPAKDQRGVARPATECDSGAFERDGP